MSSNNPSLAGLFAGLYERFVVSQASEGALQAAIQSNGNGTFHWSFGQIQGETSERWQALWQVEANLCGHILLAQKRSITIHCASILRDSLTLLVGASGVGKSTTTTAMSRRGFSIGGDDVVLLNPDTLEVTPVPRCLHLDAPGVQLLEADGVMLPGSWHEYRFVSPREVSAVPVLSYPVRSLVFLTSPRGPTPEIQPMAQAEMSARLLIEAGSGEFNDTETIAVLSRFAAGARCYSLRPGPLSATADALAELLI